MMPSRYHNYNGPLQGAIQHAVTLTTTAIASILSPRKQRTVRGAFNEKHSSKYIISEWAHYLLLLLKTRGKHKHPPTTECD